MRKNSNEPGVVTLNDYLFFFTDPYKLWFQRFNREHGLISKVFLSAIFTLICNLTIYAQPSPYHSQKAIDIGSRLELFVDDYLIDRMKGAELRLHKPQPREVVMVYDAPWEGNASAYVTLFPDGDGYRMYYRGWNFGKERRSPVICMAESSDGINWTRPDLGIIEFHGSKHNNIIMDGPNEGASHNLTPFKDANPGCPPEARYKAFGRLKTDTGSVLNAFQSADGIRWTQIGDRPVLPKGAYDSQNFAFWEAEQGHYRGYWRPGNAKVRSVRTGISTDFLHWEQQADIIYEDGRDEHMYTSGIQPYPRAKGLYIGFPTRFYPYEPKGEDDPFKESNQGETEPLFMSSRDGINFRRWDDPVIPKELPNRSENRANYAELGMFILPVNPNEITIYASESGYSKKPLLVRETPRQLRRFTYRLDGFVSVHAEQEGTLVTKPFVFSGSKLHLNIVSRGVTRVELMDEQGKPLKGFALKDCKPIQGDFIDFNVTWKKGKLKKVAGKPVQLRFEMNHADIYSMQFK